MKSMDKKTILLASDHNGSESRDYLIGKLKSWGYSVVDLGPKIEKSLGVKKVDYTDYADQLAYAITRNQDLRGVLICGTGVGMSIAANRWRGVKASLVGDTVTARKTREHNDSNVLVLGSWTTTKSEQEEILSIWLDEEFGKGRHEKRVAKLDDHDENDVVLVPGVFEIVHPGHIQLFEFAKSLGKVVVALNSDRSAEKVKGKRPRLSQDHRAHVIRSLTCVDEVVVMDDLTPENLLKETSAKYFVKGGLPEDERSIRVHDSVPEDCEVKIYPISHSYSSSKIRDSFCLKS